MLGALAITVLVPVGLVLAFVGALRQERPKRYPIVGFILNMLWFLLAIFGYCMALMG